uniref:Uncharacterized protein n=1 Tax=Timema douglasi TaxID=61478 RepID=A0A7R8VKD8_TIMDO|nr:unnamed protein product [Timema douglasi]
MNVILLTKEQRENEIIRYKNYCFYNYSSTCVYKLTRQVREVLLRPLYGDVAFSSPSQHKKGYLVGFHSHPDYRRYLLQACNRNHNYSPRNHQAPLKGSLTTQKRESDNAVSYWNPNSYLRDDIQCNIIIAQESSTALYANICTSKNKLFAWKPFRKKYLGTPERNSNPILSVTAKHAPAVLAFTASPVPPLIPASGGPEARMSDSTAALRNLSPQGGLGDFARGGLLGGTSGGDDLGGSFVPSENIGDTLVGAFSIRMSRAETNGTGRDGGWTALPVSASSQYYGPERVRAVSCQQCLVVRCQRRQCCQPCRDWGQPTQYSDRRPRVTQFGTTTYGPVNCPDERPYTMLDMTTFAWGIAEREVVGASGCRKVPILRPGPHERNRSFLKVGCPELKAVVSNYKPRRAVFAAMVVNGGAKRVRGDQMIMSGMRGGQMICSRVRSDPNMIMSGVRGNQRIWSAVREDQMIMSEVRGCQMIVSGVKGDQIIVPRVRGDKNMIISGGRGDQMIMPRVRGDQIIWSGVREDHMIMSMVRCDQIIVSGVKGEGGPNDNVRGDQIIVSGLRDYQMIWSGVRGDQNMIVSGVRGAQMIVSGVSSFMASLVLTDSSQLTFDGQHLDFSTSSSFSHSAPSLLQKVQEDCDSPSLNFARLSLSYKRNRHANSTFLIRIPLSKCYIELGTRKDKSTPPITILSGLMAQGFTLAVDYPTDDGEVGVRSQSGVLRKLGRLNVEKVNTNIPGGRVEKPLGKITLSSPERDSDLNLPILGSPDQHETSALANYATEADH